MPQKSELIQTMMTLTPDLLAHLRLEGWPDVGHIWVVERLHEGLGEGVHAAGAKDTNY